VFDDVQSMWSSAFSRGGERYAPARLMTFSSVVGTACGEQRSEVGPLYCPGDRTVYIDLRFLAQMQQQLGATGDFAQAYVIAHEMGHHVQNVLGISGRVAAADKANPSGANALSVRVELQADCLAGVWAHTAYTRELVGQADLDQALRAAASVGDDFQQHLATGQIEPERWTHGSSAQRQRWLATGFDKGTPSACDTFSGTV
jgi:predicted metalloprotease